MPKPVHVVSLEDRTRTGSLRSRDISLIRAALLRGGFVLLPSDTCYSLAMIPQDKGRRDIINGILDRPENWPMSIAFPSINVARRFVKLSLVAMQLLEVFTPGPITVICDADSDPDTLRFVRDDTIGVRIPESPIEREIAGCTDYPVTTVAVRDREGIPVRNFDRALDQVDIGTHFVAAPGWYAIQGDDDSFFSDHSTVVRVAGAEVSTMREGDIPYEQIIAASKSLPAAAFEDEG
jgi:L-threonylcarbamoyladenylate synthase